VDDAHSSPSRALATLLLQPPTQPLFDPASCSLATNAATLANIDVLFNVHEGIPPSGIPGGTQYLVDGFYGYYHYMQQSMNDKGWGCAYRSLQTLASWLYWNHYTTVATTLSHAEIQQTLVAIGDKPSAFIGSREWIGSMEVGFVLDERFGISFRTLNVASGPQLVEKAQELKHHFETQGTPVMMGGGQLAFTLLGIDYNAATGECAFLILDPHYVGAEDLETIQTKTMALEGYKAVPCGWRKVSSFSKTSFYNLCLPQRPEMGE
jgi:Ufm1-specific protease 2